MWSVCNCIPRYVECLYSIVMYKRSLYLGSGLCHRYATDKNIQTFPGLKNKGSQNRKETCVMVPVLELWHINTMPILICLVPTCQLLSLVYKNRGSARMQLIARWWPLPRLVFFFINPWVPRSCCWYFRIFFSSCVMLLFYRAISAPPNPVRVRIISRVVISDALSSSYVLRSTGSISTSKFSRYGRARYYYCFM